MKDEGCQKWFSKLAAKKLDVWNIDSDGVFICRNRLYVPDMEQFKKGILDKVHKSRMTVHPEGSKMDKDLKNNLS